MVPKQTFHKLRALSHHNKIYIVSYNPLCEYIVNVTGLYKYINRVFFGTDERYKLVDQVINLHNDNQASFIYFDDRRDNIKNVMLHFPFIKCVYIENPLQIYKKL